MPAARLSDKHAPIAALSPLAALVLGMTFFDVIPVGAAVVLLLAVAAAAFWLRARLRPVLAAAIAQPPQPPAAAIRQDILEGLPDPVLLLNRSRVVIAVNRSARDALGIELVGRSIARSLRHPSILASVDSVLEGGPSVEEDLTLPMPVPRSYSLHVFRLDDRRQAEGPAAVLVFRDETRARRAEQSRADFVANASHELRSPLSALIGFIETLRGPAREDAEARERFLAIMRDEAQRMARLIEDLLSLSRVEINEHVPPREVVDVAEVLARTREALAGRAAAKDMQIALDIKDGVPDVVGEVDQLVQVFHNLVDNAIKYGRAGTSVHISARLMATAPRGSTVAVIVADEGEGIPAVHLPRITERFYRVDEGRARRLGGTGLGLAIVKHIVNRHRGDLRIESEIGVGTRVTVQLPAESQPPTPVARGRSAQPVVIA